MRYYLKAYIQLKPCREICRAFIMPKRRSLCHINQSRVVHIQTVQNLQTGGIVRSIKGWLQSSTTDSHEHLMSTRSTAERGKKFVTAMCRHTRCVSSALNKAEQHLLRRFTTLSHSREAVHIVQIIWWAFVSPATIKSTTTLETDKKRLPAWR